jgi:hypothetical protein
VVVVVIAAAAAAAGVATDRLSIDIAPGSQVGCDVLLFGSFDIEPRRALSPIPLFDGLSVRIEN